MCVIVGGEEILSWAAEVNKNLRARNIETPHRFLFTLIGFQLNFVHFGLKAVA